MDNNKALKFVRDFAASKQNHFLRDYYAEGWDWIDTIYSDDAVIQMIVKAEAKTLTDAINAVRKIGKRHAEMASAIDATTPYC